MIMSVNYSQLNLSLLVFDDHYCHIRMSTIVMKLTESFKTPNIKVKINCNQKHETILSEFQIVLMVLSA